MDYGVTRLVPCGEDDWEIGRVSAVDMRGKGAVTASNYKRERERERERYDEIILA